MEQEINCRLEVLTKTTNIFQSRDEWQSYSLMYTRRGNEGVVKCWIVIVFTNFCGIIALTPE